MISAVAVLVRDALVSSTVLLSAWGIYKLCAFIFYALDSVSSTLVHSAVTVFCVVVFGVFVHVTVTQRVDALCTVE